MSTATIDTRGAVAPVTVPLRLTRRGRLVVTLLVAALVLVVALVGARTASAGSTDQPTGLEEVTVLRGDTLWSIAGELNEGERGANADVRDAVAQIRSLNELDSSGLMVGQKLVVPAP